MPRWFFAFIVLMIAACGQNVSDNPTPSPTATTAPPYLVQIGYSAEWMTPALEELPAGLMLYPPRTFREAISSALQEGAGHDVYIVPGRWLPSLINQREILPLNEPALRGASDFLPAGVFPAMTWQETLYAFPLYGVTPLVVVNTAQYTPPVNTFDDLLLAAGQVGAVIQPDFLITSGWLHLPNAQRPLGQSGELNTTRAAFVDYLGRLATLRTAPGVRFENTPSAFMAEEVGVYVGSSADLPFLALRFGADLAVYPVQVAEGFQGYQVVEPQVMVISLNATESAATAAQSLFIHSAEQQATLSAASGAVPLLPTQTDDPLLQRAAQIAAAGVWLPLDGGAFYEQTLPRLNTTVAQVLSGALSAEDAAAGVFGGR